MVLGGGFQFVVQVLVYNGGFVRILTGFSCINFYALWGFVKNDRFKRHSHTFLQQQNKHESLDPGGWDLGLGCCVYVYICMYV